MNRMNNLTKANSLVYMLKTKQACNGYSVRQARL